MDEIRSDFFASDYYLSILGMETYVGTWIRQEGTMVAQLLLAGNRDSQIVTTSNVVVGIDLDFLTADSRGKYMG